MTVINPFYLSSAYQPREEYEANQAKTQSREIQDNVFNRILGAVKQSRSVIDSARSLPGYFGNLDISPGYVPPSISRWERQFPSSNEEKTAFDVMNYWDRSDRAGGVGALLSGEKFANALVPGRLQDDFKPGTFARNQINRIPVVGRPASWLADTLTSPVSLATIGVGSPVSAALQGTGRGGAIAGAALAPALSGGIGRRVAGEAALGAGSFAGQYFGEKIGIPGAGLAGSLIGGGVALGGASRFRSPVARALPTPDDIDPRAAEIIGLNRPAVPEGRPDFMEGVRPAVGQGELALRYQRENNTTLKQMLTDARNNGNVMEESNVLQELKRRRDPDFYTEQDWRAEQPRSLRDRITNTLSDEQGSVAPATLIRGSARLAAPHIAPAATGALAGAAIGAYTGGDLESAITGAEIGAGTGAGLSIASQGTKAWANRNIRQVLADKTNIVRDELQSLLEDTMTAGEMNTFIRDVTGQTADAAARRGLTRTAWQNVLDAANLPRTLITAFDASAPFRQGGLLIPGRPVESAGAVGPMIKAMASPDYQKLVADEIASRPTAGLMQRARLNITKLEGSPTEMEESLMSTIAQKIPFVGGSARGYVTYLNKLRADVFDNIVKGWDEKDLTDQNLQALGNWINAATGRGRLPGFLSKYAPELNIGLFSPRFIASRVDAPVQMAQAVVGLAANKGPVPRIVAKEIARDTVAAVGTGVAILSLGVASGLWESELDPRSTEFGKIKIGNQTIDFWAGEQQIARFVAQYTMGQRKLTSTGDIVDADRDGIALRFLRSKLSPLAGLAVDLKKGETYLGDEITNDPESWREQAFNRLVPLFLQDITDAAKEEGPWAGVRAALSGIGMATQTYTENRTPFDELVSKDDPDYLIKKRDYLLEHPEDYPKAQSDDARFMKETREDIAGRMEENEAITTADGQSLVDFRETRKVLKKEQRDKLYRITREFEGGGNTQQEKWVNDYFELFNKPGVSDLKGDIDSDVFDPIEAEWAAKNPEGYEFMQRYLEAGQRPVEGQYLKDMRTLDQAGYFDTPKYRNLKSDRSESELDDLRNLVSSQILYRNDLPDDFAAAATKVLREKGQPDAVIRDVINIGKDAYQSAEARDLKKKYGKELMWFNQKATWSGYENYTAKSSPAIIGKSRRSSGPQFGYAR